MYWFNLLMKQPKEKEETKSTVSLAWQKSEILRVFYLLFEPTLAN